MKTTDPKKLGKALSGTHAEADNGISRRDFVKYSAGTVAGLYLGAFTVGCGSKGAAGITTAGYPIDPAQVFTTRQRTISFPMPGNGLPAAPAAPGSGTGLFATELSQVSQYAKYGYGAYTFAGPLPSVQRMDIMPAGYSNPTPTRLRSMLHFFAITDIHITDKEAPNQLIYLQQEDVQYGSAMTSVYSPVMPYTTHVLDAAVQTINVLHKQSPFDFGISLGDTCNSTQYNETRWFIDVIDGKVITPSSGANLGASTVDYQKPYLAAGLDKSIPWYEAMGNHDHFFMGSVPVDADPSLGIRESYLSTNIWSGGDALLPNLAKATFPCLFDTFATIRRKDFYLGALDGSDPNAGIIGTGPVSATNPPPAVAADPNRRSLLRTEWMQEFFHTTTKPAGHGFNLVDPSMGSGFACYSFVPKSDVPIKIIVLDDTQSENDGSHDIHGHGFLDATRWHWLQAELAAGQAANQLMIIAAHIPIAVANVGSEMEWWEAAHDVNATMANAVNLTDLVATLQNTPNLLMWIAGHRHVSTVKAFLPPSGGAPENGFWQVETCALRDIPQQFRTFEVYLNSDYSVSIEVTNVDLAVAEGTPAAKSRAYSIAAQQITIRNNMTPNGPNTAVQPLPDGVAVVETMDPTRPQGIPSSATPFTDPTIIYGSVPGVPSCGSYNAELFKQLSPAMKTVMQSQFPV
jgi:metallophosphoesterase (TIGR03768 family)